MSEPYNEVTEAWARSFDRCWKCGKWGVWPASLCIHHIVRGTSRHKNDLATTVLLCHQCHIDEHCDYSGLPLLLRGLVFKSLHDRDHYRLARVLEARHNAPIFVTQQEVDQQRERMGL